MTDTNQQQQTQPTQVEATAPPLFPPLPADVPQMSVRGGYACGSRIYRADGALNWPEYKAYIEESDAIDAAAADLEAEEPADRTRLRELQARRIALVYRTIAGPLARANTDLPITAEYLQSAVSPLWAMAVLADFLRYSDPFRGSTP